MAKIIQFIHPGPEHAFDSYVSGMEHKNWNSHNHLRKFCKGVGQYLSCENKIENGEFMFWGEWEPPSFVKSTHQNPPIPQYLHLPYLPTDINAIRIVTGSQNTDPCVFGEYFKYFVCQQIRKNGNLTQMASLDPGDLILFGSGKNRKFLIDTVFVVDSSISISQVEKQYQDISIDRITNYALTGCKIYKGKTFEDGDIYSFIPAGKSFFARIEVPEGNMLQLNRFITNTLAQGRKVSYVDESTIQTVWEELKILTQSSGLFLAHRVNWPLSAPHEVATLDSTKNVISSAVT